MSDFETEKAEADSCHANEVDVSLYSFINLVVLSATIVASNSYDNFGERETSM